jgi:hypothetical protein
MDMLFGHCRVCGYSLVGLKENRCPECGGPFDPDDPQTYEAFDPPLLVRFVSRKITVWTIFPLFLAGGAFVLAAFILHNPLMRDVLAVPLVLIALVTLYIVSARLRFQTWERRHRRKRR